MSSKVFGKLKSWTKGDREDNNLVRANLSGSGLPPEMQAGSSGPKNPCCSDAETAAIASIHPEYQQDDILPVLEGTSGNVTRNLDGKTSLYNSFFKRRGDEVPTEVHSAYGQEDRPTISESLKHRDGSGHEDIQSLAEHYKGRSRRLAAARELNRASTSEDRAGIILEHQLMDIDSI